MSKTNYDNPFLVAQDRYFNELFAMHQRGASDEEIHRYRQRWHAVKYTVYAQYLGRPTHTHG